MTKQKNHELAELLVFYPCNREEGSSRCVQLKARGNCPGCDGECRSRRSLTFLSAVQVVHNQKLTLSLQG
ncbi:MAG: hypothetical protein KAS07_01570 [Candidatus Pacebacteria bacterium]|nr:hypothetical protein [Candidatus Paceibacterota bacterium]